MVGQPKAGLWAWVIAELVSQGQWDNQPQVKGRSQLPYEMHYIYIYLYEFMCTACLQAHRGQKRTVDPLQLKLQMFVSCLAGAGSSTRAANALNRGTISLSPIYVILNSILSVDLISLPGFFPPHVHTLGTPTCAYCWSWSVGSYRSPY